MRLRRSALLVGLGLVAVLGAACGDDEDTATTETAAASTAAPASNEGAASTQTPATSQADGDPATTAVDEPTATAAEEATSDDTAIATDATDTGAASTPSPEQAAFIEQGDAICQSAKDELEQLGEPQSEAELPDFLEKATEIRSRQVEQLKALTPPPGDEAYWTQVVGLLDQLTAITNEMTEAASSGAGEAEMQEIIDRGTPISDQLDQLANQYGFKACGTS